jgi:single-strand DNA-binding protein
MAVLVTVVGNLTADPELRYTSRGDAVVNVRVAVNTRYKEGDTWKERDTEFYEVTIWRFLAENVAASLQRGDRVILYGRLTNDKFTTRDNVDVERTKITASAMGPDLSYAEARLRKIARSRSNSSEEGGE